jgi:hypothetical protein
LGFPYFERAILVTRSLRVIATVAQFSPPTIKADVATMSEVLIPRSASDAP